MVETTCWYLQENHQKPAFLGWCRIASTHSNFTTIVCRSGAFRIVIQCLLGPFLENGCKDPLGKGSNGPNKQRKPFSNAWYPPKTGHCPPQGANRTTHFKVKAILFYGNKHHVQMASANLKLETTDFQVGSLPTHFQMDTTHFKVRTADVKVNTTPFQGEHRTF